MLPNGLLQTLHNNRAQRHLAAAVANLRWNVVDQDQTVCRCQSVSDQLGAALTGGANVTTHC